MPWSNRYIWLTCKVFVCLIIRTFMFVLSQLVASYMHDTPHPEINSLTPGNFFTYLINPLHDELFWKNGDMCVCIFEHSSMLYWRFSLMQGKNRHIRCIDKYCMSSIWYLSNGISALQRSTFLLSAASTCRMYWQIRTIRPLRHDRHYWQYGVRCLD